jgi:hypothetical protein
VDPVAVVPETVGGSRSYDDESIVVIDKPSASRCTQPG